MFGDCDLRSPLLLEEISEDGIPIKNDDFIGRNLLNDRSLNNPTYCRTLEQYITDTSKMQSDNYSNSEGLHTTASNDDLSSIVPFNLPFDLGINPCSPGLPTSIYPGTDSAWTSDNDIFNLFFSSESQMELAATFACNFSYDDNNTSNDSTASQKQYHPDYDHCYSKLSETRDLSDSDVDVVSFDPEADEEFQIPVVPKMPVLPLRNKMQRSKSRVQKSQRTKKNQSPLSAKTFNDAMKRNITRITDVRKINSRQINNSVETSPSNSVPSSASSSRSSSDVEDAGKRANHNSSERKRREVLRRNLQTLRECVPALKHNVKAPKVHILNSAKEYITLLQRESWEKEAIKKNERSQKRLLEIKVQKLKKHLNFR